MSIQMYMHCKKCLRTVPTEQSPGEYARLAVGLNEDGEIEVHCERHDEIVGVLTHNGVIPAELRKSKCAACEAGEPHVH